MASSSDFVMAFRGRLVYQTYHWVISATEDIRRCKGLKDFIRHEIAAIPEINFGELEGVASGVYKLMRANISKM